MSILCVGYKRRIITVIKKFDFHSNSFILAACIIIVAFSCTVHALMDTILSNGLTVGLSGIQSPLITVNDSAFQSEISGQSIFPCINNSYFKVGR